ncbi:DUF559 domain-containing protein [Aeromicrobium sp. Sec7.5]|uniref:DUF559 domain-containing protein n=1 Tax=Aeromicrobium sp. Sec7.5 TaxID=3121276 RepID=UPI002FE4607A
MPPTLHGRPFTRREALSLGLTDGSLRGRRFVRLHEGVYRTAQTEPTVELRLQAAGLTLPGDAAVSHVTSLRLRGLAVGPLLPLHFATCHPHQHRDPDVVLHRYRRDFAVDVLRGFLVTSPARTFVDLGTQLDDRRLLRVGDWMVGTGLVDLDELHWFCLDSHLDGVRRARRVVKLVRERVASVRESDLRWWIHRGGLPEPEVNVDILDDHGRWLARGDLVYRRQKILVEYDGWQHERDAAQRQWDHIRREQLEAAGWRLIVVTSIDMANPRRVITRIRQALNSSD